MDRKCNKCGELKCYSEFYKDKTRPHGIMYECKVCLKRRSKTYQRSEAGIRNMRARASTPEAKDARKLKSIERRLMFPERMKAKAAVMIRVRQGRMPRASEVACSTADRTCHGRHEYHHDSYLKDDWLSVRALCRSHHCRWHRDNKPTAHPDEIKRHRK